MIPFKILSGFYHNITYSNGETVNLDFSKVNKSDIQWFSNDIPINIEIILSEKIDVIYNGISIIDGSPIFMIDIDKELRDIMIKNILKT